MSGGPNVIARSELRVSLCYDGKSRTPDNRYAKLVSCF